jgi:hypothetical protein
MTDEGVALDMKAIDDAMGVWLESVEWVGVEYGEGEMPDVLELDLIEKGSRSEAGRKAARARWGNRGPDSPEASAKRSEAARRAAATRRAKREAGGAGKGPETDEQAAARMGKEFEAKRNTGEPIDAIAEIAARDDYAAFILKHRDALGLKDTSDALKRTGVDEPTALVRACDLIRASERRHEDQYIAMSGDQRASLTASTNAFTKKGDVMTATPSEVAVRILQGDRCKSQFETNRSRGALSPDIRAGQETAMFRVHPGMSPSARPTYGYVSVGKPTANGPMQYGEIRFQLRDSVKERTTITMGDSLGSPAVPVRVGSSVGPRAASDSRGHGIYAFSGVGVFQEGNYAEAQIMGGWGRSDVTKVYVPSSMRFSDVDAAAAAAGIPVEYY